MPEQLHASVERAAMAKLEGPGRTWEAIRAAVEAERRLILDVVDAMACRADCEHQRVLLNQILEIYGREPVTDACLQTPELCSLERVP